MEKKLIFKKTNEGFKDIIGIIGLTIFWAVLTFGIIKNVYLGIITIVIGVLLIAFVFKIKYNFEIGNKGIEFFRIFSNKQIEEIKYTQIAQIRFEDGFTTSLRAGNESRIYVYPKSNIRLNIRVNKSGYIPLIIGKNKDEEIIRILSHCQSENIEVKILTSHKEIRKQLNLKNWNQP